MLNRPLASANKTFAPGSPLHYRPDIDGLRAIAVLSVVFFHAKVPGFSGGFAGVDIFFVISGYLITSLLIKDIDRNRFSLLAFYLRRAKRIFPALAVVLAATVAASWFILLPDEFNTLGRSLYSTTIFVSNFHFAADLGYFSAPAIDKPLLHTWSLAIEEQFYILFPMALATLLPRLGRDRIIAVLSLVAVLSLLAAEVLVRKSPETAFYMPHVRAWELLLGALVAVGQDRILLGNRSAFLLSALGLGAIAVTVTFLDETARFPGLSALLPCAGAALLLLAGGKRHTPVQAIISLPPVRFVGLISYSLYLWHWPLFSLTHYHLNRELGAGEAAILIVLSLVLAALSWRFVEQPVRLSSLGLASAPRGIAVTAMPLLLLAAAGGWMTVGHGLPWRLPAEAAQAYYQSKEVGVSSRGCETTAQATEERCSFGVPRKDDSYDMVVWGDSHAIHFIPVLAKIAAGGGLSARQITPSGCPPLLEATRLDADHLVHSKCVNNDKLIKEFIQRNKRLKVIIIAARWSVYVGAEAIPIGKRRPFLINAAHKEVSAENSRKVLAEELQKTVDYFLSEGLHVVILGQVPEFPYSAVRCNLRKMVHKEQSHDCSIDYNIEKRYIEYPNNIIAQMRQSERFTRIFPHQFLCKENSCVSYLNGTILYRDGNHLNRFGAEALYPFLMEKLHPLLANVKAQSGELKLSN